jgi:NTE family protein
MSSLSDLRRGGVGLALGGGAARGLAHIGVLKALDQEGIPVRFVAGTSAGSVIGAALCAGFSWSEIREKARSLEWSDIASFIIPRMGLMSMEKFERFLDAMLGSKSFDELAIPLSVVTVDLVSGEEVVINDGPVSAAVRASCSIPGIFEPAARGGKLLVDGGLRNNVPADVVRKMGAGVVIAVSLSAGLGMPHSPRNILDVIHYSFTILVRHAVQEGLEEADIVINPRLDDIGYQEIRRIDDLVERGETAAAAALRLAAR